eukprot:TRINITY_DN1589_c0_g1_i1.p1 TRINITY_DN1589_c0_g1~~TRINITY_DN1589_c0_g1_i1.p1  ORF type:complete len:113 (+),score=0.88 TRINITY_DN1589_c0_g1_i1:64-402(+)
MNRSIFLALQTPTLSPFFLRQVIHFFLKNRFGRQVPDEREEGIKENEKEHSRRIDINEPPPHSFFLFSSRFQKEKQNGKKEKASSVFFFIIFVFYIFFVFVFLHPPVSAIGK